MPNVTFSAFLNRAAYGIGQAITLFFVLWFLLLLSSSSVFYFVFLAYSQPSPIRCLPYFHTWCGLSTNLGFRSETCCKRLDEIHEAKNLQKNFNLRTIAQVCRAISSQLRHVSSIGKHRKQQYRPHGGAHNKNCELRPTSG